MSILFKYLLNGAVFNWVRKRLIFPNGSRVRRIDLVINDVRIYIKKKCISDPFCKSISNSDRNFKIIEFTFES